MPLQTIKRCVVNLKFSSHAKDEMLYEETGSIYEREIKEAILSGEIIGEYPKDKPYPSYLVYGQTSQGRHLHIVCAPAVNEQILIIVTVYQPNPELWINYRKRRKK